MKIRCSSLGDLMGNGRAKDSIGQSAYDLIDSYMIEAMYGRKKQVFSKYFTKGNEAEEDSVSLYCQVKNVFLTKNKERFENDWITGHPDLITGDLVIDTKTSWDIFTFHKSELDKGYWWQLQGYMWLTGATRAHLAYCLVDTPPQIQSDELYRLKWKFINGEDNPEYDAAADELTRAMTVSDIPAESRLKLFEIEVDYDAREQILHRLVALKDYIANWTLNGNR